jgi:hypothetical protein
VVKLRKITSLPEETREQRIQTTNSDLKKYTKTLHGWNIRDDIQLYEHHGKILAVKNGKNIESII